MAKNIFKELIIILLLIIFIIVLLGVVLYDYVPTNKIIPEKVSYSTPQNVKQELKNSSEIDEDKIILTYTLDQDDLYNYQKINDYKPGKTNPFSTYKPENVEKPEGNGTGNGSTGSTNTPVSDPTVPGGVNPGNYTNNNGLK